MPVTERETADALASVPQDSWLRTYVRHGFLNNTAPISYHVGVGLTLLATTVPPEYGMHYAGVLHPNQYTMLLGRSGEDRKSTALNLGKGILDDVASSLVGFFPGSPEGLIQSLADQPTQMIPISELGKFLSAAQKGYFEPSKTLLADLWDCGPTQRRRANVVIRVDAPRLSIGAACSIPYLEKHTLAEDWTGGFMGRWLVMYGRRERTVPNPIPDNTYRTFLVEELTRRATSTSAGWCMGLTSAAEELWHDWYYDVMNRQLPRNIVGIRARAPTLARKIALALAWDYGPVLEGDPWRMGERILAPAIAITELHVTSLVHLADVIAEHPDARLRRSIIRTIDENGGICTLGTILQTLKMRRRPVVEMLDALKEEGRVKEHRRPGGALAYEHCGNSLS